MNYMCSVALHVLDWLIEKESAQIQATLCL